MKTIKDSVRTIAISLVLIVSGMFLPMLTSASVSPAFVDFGEVIVGSSSTRSLRVTNTNAVPIEVTFSIPRNGCGFSINSRPLSLGVDDVDKSGLIQVIYAPRDLGPCSAMLYVTIIGSVQRVPLMGIGIMPKPAPLSTIVIGDFNTGIIDKQYEDQLISARINECAKEVKNHGKFVSCVARLINELKRDGIITEEEKDTIQGCAAQASIP